MTQYHTNKIIINALLDRYELMNRVRQMDAEDQPSNHNREVVFPYAYGSLAFSLGKKGENYTHKWICYVRGVNNEDLSYLIKKVVFKLHSSFQNPIKQIYKPPFEIQEVGWGEFEILIQVHFHHPNMPHIEIPHMLKLHHTHSSGSQQSKKPLCSECYDEIVFSEMDEYIEKILEQQSNQETQLMHVESQQMLGEENEGGVQVDQPLKSITHYTQFFTALDASDHRNRLDDALRFIKGEISSLQEKMRIADLDIQKVYEQIYTKTS